MISPNTGITHFSDTAWQGQGREAAGRQQDTDTVLCCPAGDQPILSGMEHLQTEPDEPYDPDPGGPAVILGGVGAGFVVRVRDEEGNVRTLL